MPGKVEWPLEFRNLLRIILQVDFSIDSLHMEKKSYCLLCYAKIIRKIHIFNIKYTLSTNLPINFNRVWKIEVLCLSRRFLLVLKDLTLFTPVAHVPFPKNFLTNFTIVLHFRIFRAFNKRFAHQHLPCFFKH